ncbi:MAG: hypothetical protein R2712_32065 [Vicinamibacterales bacterium]
MPSRVPESSPPLAFHGGTPGALAPFGLFLAGVAWLALAGAPDEHGFWPILVAALIAGAPAGPRSDGLLQSPDRGHEPADRDADDHGLAARPGVIGTVMSASGFVDALVWLARLAGLPGGGYVAAAFLACCLVSTSTGTSFRHDSRLRASPVPSGRRRPRQSAMLAGAIWPARPSAIRSRPSPTRRSPHRARKGRTSAGRCGAA